MYRVIGADEKHYGPVSAEQIREWIAAGRANGNTLVQREGETVWSKLSEFAEFAEALADKSPQPGPAALPAPGSTVGGSTPPNFPGRESELIAHDYALDIGHCVGRAWTLVLRHFWLLVGASFVVMLLASLISLLAGVFLGGFYLLILKLVRGEAAQFGDAFEGFSRAFLALFLAGLIASILTALGIVLLVIPGIYLAVVWLPSLALIADQRMSFWQGLELSRKVVQRHWWTWFGLLLTLFLIHIVGHLALCVGIFVAIPISFATVAYAYEDVFVRPGKFTSMPL